MELIAHEPLVSDPVAMCYDEYGRAYVAEMHDYPHVIKEADVPFTDQDQQPARGRIVLLEDSDGDGQFDRSSVFAEQLSWPTGLALWKGGLYVAATPDIWYLKDTDGDRRADVRRKVFTGFRKYNVQAVMNNLVWGLDHQIYGAASGNGGQVFHADENTDPARLVRQDFRFDPPSETLEAISGSGRFGNSFDSWGNRFLCNIRNPCQHVVLPQHYLARNPQLAVPGVLHDCAPAGDQLPVYPISEPEAWRVLRARRWSVSDERTLPRSELVGSGYVTSSSGVTIYRGDQYPAHFQDMMFLGEVAGNLVHRQLLEPEGVTFRAHRVDEQTEFVRSTDNWFRPVNFVNAPDGTLHILDMYREVVEHPWSVPDDLRAQLDFRSGEDRGRIYRLAPPGFKPPPPPQLGRATTAELVALLESPNGWHRDTAHRLLFERQDQAAVPLLKHLLRASSSPLARLHALWSLQGLAALASDDLQLALADQHSGVREHAVRLAEPHLDQPSPLRQRVLQLAHDPHPRVRFQVAFSLGNCSDKRRIAALAQIARQDPADPWIRAAVLSSVPEQAFSLLGELLNDPAFTADVEASGPWLRELSRMGAASDRSEEQAEGEPWKLLRSLRQVPVAVQLEIVIGLAGSSRTFPGPQQQLPPDLVDQLAALREAAQRLAQDPAAEPAERVAAIEALARLAPEASPETLQRLLDPREPATVQQAAAGVLARLPHDSAADLLLAAWRSYTPIVREEILEAFLAERSRTDRLLEALEQQHLHSRDLSLRQQQRLRQHSDPNLRARALRLLGEADMARGEVLRRYEAALTHRGNRERGRQVFQRACATCHVRSDAGVQLGPDLVTVRHRTPENILMHVLDPNREVSPEYLEYLVERSDGRTASGIIAAETATSITLQRPEGIQEIVLRAEIEQIVATGKSIMPEGLEQSITVDDMADLLTFLLQPPDPPEPSP